MSEIESRGKGRPKGRTEQGKAMKGHLFQVGLDLIESEGFEKATLRKMAQKAGVSPGLFYKYFPNKSALVLEIHELLTTEFENRWENLSSRSWDERAFDTLVLSLDSLKSHRQALQSLIPVLVGGAGQNIFSEDVSVTRIRVQSLFYRALKESKNPPGADLIEPLSRLIYYLHLAVLLFWLLDQSKDQSATESLLKSVKKLLKPIHYLIKLPGARKALLEFDKVISVGLVG